MTSAHLPRARDFGPPRPWRRGPKIASTAFIAAGTAAGHGAPRSRPRGGRRSAPAAGRASWPAGRWSIARSTARLVRRLASPGGADQIAVDDSGARLKRRVCAQGTNAASSALATPNATGTRPRGSPRPPRPFRAGPAFGPGDVRRPCDRPTSASRLLARVLRGHVRREHRSTGETTTAGLGNEKPPTFGGPLCRRWRNSSVTSGAAPRRCPTR